MTDETETRHPLDGMILTMHGDRLWWCDPDGKKEPILYMDDGVTSGKFIQCPTCNGWIYIPG